MEICINCSNELEKKKYNRKNRLKCMSCGYETSNWEIDKEKEEYLERRLAIEKQQYKQNDNYD